MAAVEITALAAGAGPPENKMAARRKLCSALAGGPITDSGWDGLPSGVVVMAIKVGYLEVICTDRQRNPRPGVCAGHPSGSVDGLPVSAGAEVDGGALRVECLSHLSTPCSPSTAKRLQGEFGVGADAGFGMTVSDGFNPANELLLLLLTPLIFQVANGLERVLEHN